MITVAIISPEMTLKAITQVIDHQDFGCVFRKYIYEKLEDIASIYEQCKDDCDVIFCSGELGYNQLMLLDGDILPCSFILYEDKHILSMFLNILIEHPEIPINRIYCDFLTPINEFMHLNQYLPPDKMPYCFESLNYVYEDLLAYTKELWESGRIDLLVTRCGNILEEFDKMGIPYVHILPSESVIAESIRNALDKVILNSSATAYKVCVLIKLLSLEQLPLQEQEFYEVTTHKLILDFRKQADLLFFVHPSSGRFELVGDSGDYDNATNYIQNLIYWLTEKTNIEFRLGAGISNTADESHYHAEIALLESIKYGKNDGFLINGRNSSLTGPLSLSNELNYSYSNQKALEYSKQNGINESNLLKIVGLFRLNPCDPLTAPALAKWLNITPRSCNRIILQLLESELIREIAPLKKETKGRPTRQYRFDIQNCEKAFF